MANNTQDIKFITLLRGIAALLVVWDHLVGNWLSNNSMVWLPIQIIREYVTTPLGIIQDFGWFGVCLFFLISGFIITHVAIRENRTTFFIRRIFRIYPPLIVSIILILVLDFVFSRGQFMKLSYDNMLLSFTLLNFLFEPQNVINGVAWTLVIEMLFYLIIFAFLTYLKERPIYFLASIDLVVGSIVVSARWFGENFFLLAASVAYLPFLAIGQIVYLYWTKRVSLKISIIFSVVNYFMLVLGLETIHSQFYVPGNSYMVSFFYACAIFLIALYFNMNIRINKTVKLISESSYSLYLTHGFVGLYLLNALVPFYGYSISILITLIIVLTVAIISWRLIERPSQNIARTISNIIHERRMK